MAYNCTLKNLTGETPDPMDLYLQIKAVYKPAILDLLSPINLKHIPLKPLSYMYSLQTDTKRRL